MIVVRGSAQRGCSRWKEFIMSHQSRVRWPLAAALLVVFSVWPIVPAQAKTLDVYDRDSLVHLSSEVIEAEIVRSYSADKLALINVRVTMVQKGGFKNGQNVVVAASDFYRKPKKDEPHNSMSLEVGDRLVLFLARSKAN